MTEKINQKFTTFRLIKSSNMSIEISAFRNEDGDVGIEEFCIKNYCDSVGICLYDNNIRNPEDLEKIALFLLETKIKIEQMKENK